MNSTAFTEQYRFHQLGWTAEYLESYKNGQRFQIPSLSQWHSE